MTEQPTAERSIFLSAIEAGSPADRAAYLDRACGGDGRLRSGVEELLAAHDRLGAGDPAATAGYSAGAAPGATTAPAAVLPRECAGMMIGPYKLLQQIGEGGMGTVYMVEQTEPIRRKVALKIIKAGMDSRQVVARFEAERQALAMMDHVNIARVIDGGTTENGRPYFVMELVHGVPITKYCDDNHLTPRERLELFVPVCQAIQHAHQKGIIHRDIKPSNVMITLYDGKPVPKVIDFGVAKATEQKLTERTLFTQYGTVVGTLEYMSPEQAEMSALGVDTRGDIFSLGVLLYELLTGSTPLTHKRLKEAAYGEVLRMIREEEPPKPSTRLSDSGEALASISANRHMEPSKLTKLVRGELDWIVMKTLEKDRNRRYETAKDFAADVQHYLDDEPVQACPPSAWYRVRKFVRRNKGRLAIAAGAFLAMTVMAATIGWAVRDRVARQAEIEQAETARRATVEGQVRDSLNTARTLIAENKLASARDKLAQARAQWGNDGSALGSLAAEVEAGAADLDRFQQFLDLIDRAHQAETAPLLEPAWTADGSPSSAGTPPLARAGERRPAAAVPFLLEALRLHGVLERDDWNSTLEGGLLGEQQVDHIRRFAYEELLWLAADVFRRQQEHRSQQKLSPQAAARQALVYLGIAESAHRATQALYALRAHCRMTLGEEAAAQADTQLADKTPPTMALDHSLRGQAAYDAKQLAEGVHAFEAALRLEPTHYWSLMKLGYCLCDLGQGPVDFAGAARVFTGCILKRPDHAHAYYCRGNAYSMQRRYEEAVADYSKAIELDPMHANAWCCRGAAYSRLGQRGKAVADSSQAIKLDPNNASIRYNRGANYFLLGQPDMAVAEFDKAIELDGRFAPAWNARGAAYYLLGKPGKALADYTEAIALDPKHALARYNRGNAYGKLGQKDKALADYSEATVLDPKLAQAWFNRAIIYDDLRQTDKALADLDKAIELDRKFAPAWANRGFIHDKLGQPDKALADFSEAIALNQKYPLAWFNRGVIYNKLGQPDKALADFSETIALDPPSPLLVQAYLVRAQTHGRLAHFEEARADYQAALKRAPDHPWGRNALAWLLATCPDAKLCDPDQAVELAKKAVQLGPKVGNYWKTLGVAHYRAGDWKAAVAALDKSLELRKDGEAAVQLFLAMAHRKLGNHDEARKAYEQAVEWLEKNKESLGKDQRDAEELRRFQTETEEVLELKKK